MQYALVESIVLSFNKMLYWGFQPIVSNIFNNAYTSYYIYNVLLSNILPSLNSQI